MDALNALRQFTAQPANSVAEKIVWYDKIKPVIDRIVSAEQSQESNKGNVRAELKARDLEVENLKARIDMLQSELIEARGKLAAQQPEISRLKSAAWNAVKALEAGQKE